MSETRLNKFLERPIDIPEGERKRKAVIFTDSKGSYVKAAKNVLKEEQIAAEIEWDIHIGGTSNTILSKFSDHLDQLVKANGRIHVYIWAGTCDLTTKKGKFIYQNDDPIRAKKILVENLLRAEETVLEKESVRLTVLQVPYLSISKWNAYRGHKNPESFSEQDKSLKNHIDIINTVIQQINTRLGVRSPKFNLDVERSKKNKDTITKYSTNWGLYKDGVHPAKTLAAVWMRHITKEVIKDCY